MMNIFKKFKQKIERANGRYDCLLVNLIKRKMYLGLATMEYQEVVKTYNKHKKFLNNLQGYALEIEIIEHMYQEAIEEC